MDILNAYSLFDWILMAIAAFFIGLSKAGLRGVDMLNITILAIVLGSKTSTGMALPLLCVADFIAVKYYHRHAQWSHFWKLMPWMVIGILIAVIVGKGMDEVIFRKVIAVIILLAVLIMLIFELRKSVAVPTNKLFVVVMGLSSGFTTMLGNLAGAFSSIYFLAMRLPKNDFIGTVAWVFFFVNLFKLPFQAFYWNNIHASTLYTGLVLLPALIAGFWAGVKIIVAIKETSYRKVVIVLTFIGALFIFFKK